jgi:capsid protein
VAVAAGVTHSSIRARLISCSVAVSAFGNDAERIDREITADDARADALNLVSDSNPRKVTRTGAPQAGAEAQPADQESNAG